MSALLEQVNFDSLILYYYSEYNRSHLTLLYQFQKTMLSKNHKEQRQVQKTKNTISNVPNRDKIRLRENKSIAKKKKVKVQSPKSSKKQIKQDPVIIVIDQSSQELEDVIDPRVDEPDQSEQYDMFNSFSCDQFNIPDNLIVSNQGPNLFHFNEQMSIIGEQQLFANLSQIQQKQLTYNYQQNEGVKENKNLQQVSSVPQVSQIPIMSEIHSVQNRQSHQIPSENSRLSSNSKNQSKLILTKNNLKQRMNSYLSKNNTQQNITNGKQFIIQCRTKQFDHISINSSNNNNQNQSPIIPEQAPIIPEQPPIIQEQSAQQFQQSQQFQKSNKNKRNHPSNLIKYQKRISIANQIRKQIQNNPLVQQQQIFNKIAQFNNYRVQNIKQWYQFSIITQQVKDHIKAKKIQKQNMKQQVCYITAMVLQEKQELKNLIRLKQNNKLSMIGQSDKKRIKSACTFIMKNFYDVFQKQIDHRSTNYIWNKVLQHLGLSIQQKTILNLKNNKRKNFGFQPRQSQACRSKMRKNSKKRRKIMNLKANQIQMNGSHFDDSIMIINSQSNSQEKQNKKNGLFDQPVPKRQIKQLSNNLQHINQKKQNSQGKLLDYNKHRDNKIANQESRSSLSEKNLKNVHVIENKEQQQEESVLVLQNSHNRQQFYKNIARKTDELIEKMIPIYLQKVYQQQQSFFCIQKNKFAEIHKNYGKFNYKFGGKIKMNLPDKVKQSGQQKNNCKRHQAKLESHKPILQSTAQRRKFYSRLANKIDNIIKQQLPTKLSVIYRDFSEECCLEKQQLEEIHKKFGIFSYQFKERELNCE